MRRMSTGSSCGRMIQRQVIKLIYTCIQAVHHLFSVSRRLVDRFYEIDPVVLGGMTRALLGKTLG
jgi:hypothetical protein